MSKISEAADKINEQFDTFGKAVDGIVEDVKFLKEKIEELQNNPGPISPEDQVILNQLVSRSISLAEKVVVLDQATERPVTPVVPPVEPPVTPPVEPVAQS